MSRIVILDLLFHWPPDGGARVEVLQLARYFQPQHEAILMIPRFDDEFPRGQLDVQAGELGIDLHILEVPGETVHYEPLCEMVRDAVTDQAPDMLTMADAWHLKPRLLASLGEFKPVVRFFAHEGLCLKGHGHMFRDGHICRVDTLREPGDYERCCLPCRKQWRDSARTRIFDREMGLAGLDDGTYVDDLREGLASANAVIVANTDMVERLAPYARRVILQSMGTDPNLFRKMSPPSGGRFLFLGRAEDFLKGAHVFLEAGRLLRQERDDFTLTLTGRPAQGDATRGCEWVEFLDPVPHEEVPALINRALAVVLAPIWPEPLPISAFESFACGRPLIASAVGGLKDWVRDRENGLLVPPGDPGALARAMNVLLADRALVGKLSDAAEQIGKCHTWKHVFDHAYGPLLAEL